MKNQKTILFGVAVLVIVSFIVFYASENPVASTDYGVTRANAKCDGDDYTFSGTFHTWRVGMHQVQAICSASHNIQDFYELDVKSSGTYDWSVTYDADDFNTRMPCEKVTFQLYDSDAKHLFWKVKSKALPECGTSAPTPTPTTTPPDNGETPPEDPGLTRDDMLVMGSVAAIILIIAVIARRRPPRGTNK